MNAHDIIGQWVTIERPHPQQNGTQRIFGLCEWASEDMLNFRLQGIGHIGISRIQGGTVSLYVPTLD